MAEVLSADTVDAALRAQLEMQSIWEAAGEPTGGWKVGFTTKDPRQTNDNRDRFEPGYRPFGFILKSRILASGITIPRQWINSCQVEPELCVVLGEPLSGSVVTAEQARKAVRSVAPAFEINEARFVNKVTPMSVRIAAGLSQWGIVVGETIDPPDWDVRSTTVTVSCNGEVKETVTLPETAIDDIHVSLVRLCARLDRFGRGLREGDHVITGAFAHHKVGAGETWSADFSGIGEVTATFADQPL